MTDFVDTLPPDGTLVHTPGLEPALLKDVARTFALLGVQSFRASVVKLPSMSVDSQWSISEFGEVSPLDASVPLDSSFPGASNSLAQLEDADIDTTMMQQLGAQRWRFAWRLDKEHAVVSEAYFHERRDVLIEIDIALLRLICGMGMQAPRDTDGKTASGTAQSPAVERRSKVREPIAAPRIDVRPSESGSASPSNKPVPTPTRVPTATRVALIALVLSTVLTGWLASVAAPQASQALLGHQVENSRLRGMAHDTMLIQLSTAMASGDYGHVQDFLSNFASLGYFTGAAVTNARQRVVSLAGQVERLRIGDAVPPELAGKGQMSELKLGSQGHGQLLLFPAPSSAPEAEWSTSLEWAAWGAFIAAVVANFLFALKVRRERR